MINNLAIERGFLGPGSTALSSDGRIFVLDCYHYTGGVFRITVQDFDENFLFEFSIYIHNYSFAFLYMKYKVKKCNQSRLQIS